ncbi:substance-P receptor, partial [Trichonephila clavata]
MMSYPSNLSIYSGIFGFILISADLSALYYAIIYPLSGRWTKNRGRLVVFLIWFSSIALSSFQLVHGKAEKFEIGGQEVYDCNEIWGEVEGK